MFEARNRIFWKEFTT